MSPAPKSSTIPKPAVLEVSVGPCHLLRDWPHLCILREGTPEMRFLFLFSLALSSLSPQGKSSLITLPQICLPKAWGFLQGSRLRYRSLAILSQRVCAEKNYLVKSETAVLRKVCLQGWFLASIWKRGFLEYSHQELCNSTRNYNNYNLLQLIKDWLTAYSVCGNNVVYVELLLYFWESRILAELDDVCVSVSNHTLGTESREFPR